MNAVSGLTLPVSGARVLVDAHVHYHRCFDPGAFLDAARVNCERGAGQLGLHPKTPGCLLLADCSGENGLALLLEQNGRRGLGGDWTVGPGEEDGVLIASHSGLPRIALVAGRQIVTREGLEVLALACTARIPDSLPLEEVIAAAWKADALTVLPWGFGKWWFKRGGLVRRLMDSADPSRLFLGDNGGRTALLGRPGLLKRAQARGYVVLPGSDPLPFASQVGRVGGYGFCLEDDITLACAGSSIKAALQHGSRRLQVYGAMESLGDFLKSQVALAARKHLRKRNAMAGVRDEMPILSRGKL